MMAKIRRILAATAVLVMSFGLAACSSGNRGADPTGVQRSSTGSTSSEAKSLVQGLDAPWSIAFLNNTALISERDSGKILEFSGSGGTREVGSIADAAASGEGGLLGIAIREGYLYAYMTTGQDNRIVRYRLNGQDTSLTLGQSETILTGIPSASYHDGGRIAFGPDGMLYATTGDAGNRANAQNRESLAGKILRLSPDGGIPQDNPFPNSPVYSYGHRNPQGLAWDAQGTLYSSEFGQDTWDELNVITAGGNYGWPTVEGIANREGFVDPVQQWRPSDASPSGMTIVNGTIYIANLRGESLRAVPINDLPSSTKMFQGEYGRLRDVVQAPDGALWILTNNTDGRGDPGQHDDQIIRVNI
ncbi:MAG: PQQ-dependent sugar dehydrogenase [Bifidobacterium crudilactis]|nr:PQQ-dependent sugar dehydrogenase [Bifidobacterium crudilactis]